MLLRCCQVWKLPGSCEWGNRLLSSEVTVYVWYPRLIGPDGGGSGRVKIPPPSPEQSGSTAGLLNHRGHGRLNWSRRRLRAGLGSLPAGPGPAHRAAKADRDRQCPSEARALLICREGEREGGWLGRREMGGPAARRLGHAARNSWPGRHRCLPGPGAIAAGLRAGNPPPPTGRHPPPPLNLRRGVTCN